MNAIHRQPLNLASVEVTNTVHVIADCRHHKMVMALLEQESQVHPRPQTSIKITHGRG